MTRFTRSFMSTVRFMWKSLKKTVQEFGQSAAFTEAASVAYFAIFSLPGLLIIIIWLIGNFMDADKISDELYGQISTTMGTDVSKNLQNIIEKTLVDADSMFMKTIGVISLVFAASTLFFRIQKTLNELWQVKPVPKKAFKKFLLDRVNSVGMILSMGFILLISMLISTVISLGNQYIIIYYGLDTYSLLEFLNFIISFGATFVLFALMFKFLPDVKVPWNSVWAGAFLTASLFTIGKILLSLYFDKFEPTSAFGAAGSVLLIMMWVNYSCLILFFGALYTRVFSELKGIEVDPSRHAKWDAEKKIEELKESGKLSDTDL